MPKLLQIDSCRGILSTGKISEQIGALARANGWETYIAHGARYVGYSDMISYQIGSQYSEYMHFAKSLLLDKHGLGSSCNTKKLVKWIDKIQPDIIQLHCIHGHYLNYEILFDYLNSTHIPVVWTFHDCWAFTGHCAYFVSANCMRWKDSECGNCPLLKEYPKSIIDRSCLNFLLKKRLFNSVKNLTIVPVSKWLTSLVRESFLGNHKIQTITNGIDISLFSPRDDKTLVATRQSLGIPRECKMILGVASAWDERKGLNDFIKISALIPENWKIVLVGLNEKQINNLPANIIALQRTTNAQQLADIYATADVFVNPTYADTYPTTNLEAISCGTPVITYLTGGSPESITEQTGIVLQQGDIKGIISAINTLVQNNRTEQSKICRAYAEKHFDRNDRFLDYVNLYNELLQQ